MVDYTLVKYNELSSKLDSSPYGYWILPNGDVLCLNVSMSHGEVAAEHEPLIWERIDKEQDEGNLYTKCDFAACDLGWLKLNLALFYGDINCSWRLSPTPSLINSLRFVIDIIDPEFAAEYWWDTGTGSYQDMMVAYMATTV